MKKIINSIRGGGAKTSNCVLASIIALVAVATAKAETVYDPDCVLYYDFETIDNGKVVNLVNPGTMDGTIVQNNSKSPTLVEDSPASRIRQSMTSATYETSEKSLENYVSSGRIECMPTDVEWFSKTNFTIECFFKANGTTQTYTPLFRRYGGHNVQVNLGIAGTSGYMAYNVSTNTAGQIESTFFQFVAGIWYHVAMVVDQTGETKTMKFYINGESIRTVSLDSNLANENKDGASGPHYEKWFIAGADNGSSFDGKIDSFRVTLRALEPNEFLSTKKFPVGRTLAHVKFDDGTVNADPDGATMTNGVNTAARSGGAAATFSDDVPGAIIRDGENGEILTKHNKNSLSLSGSKVTWGSSSDNYQDTYYIRNTLSGEKRTAWTVEFWAKPNGTQSVWGRIISATANGDMGNWYTYALTFYQSTKLSLRSLAAPGGAEEGDSQASRIDFDIDKDICDGKWHHIAFTFAPKAADPTKSEVKFYIDYGDMYSKTYTQRADKDEILVVHPDRLIMSMGNGGSYDYDGLIDELRISDGALEPSQFLRAEHAPGFSIIIR
ncbi:MAG: LamG domain-containing protein [Kiritimatiellae bacterium]|nr:LamG domain-containing protein [Kiritimatiellia bacterium]